MYALASSIIKIHKQAAGLLFLMNKNIPVASMESGFMQDAVTAFAHSR